MDGRWYIIGDANRADFWTPKNKLGFTIIRKEGVDPLVFQEMVNLTFTELVDKLNEASGG